MDSNAANSPDVSQPAVPGNFASSPTKIQMINIGGRPFDSAQKADTMQVLAEVLNMNESENFKKLEINKGELDKVIEKLDFHLNTVLRKQEYEYLQAYNIYVKRKEKELRELINSLNEKNSNNNFKDLKIQQQEITIDKMRHDAFQYEQKQEALLKEIKGWKEKFKLETEEKEFFHKQALDAKRKNKLLKVAIGRLQIEREDVKQAAAIEAGNISIDEKDTDTFITGAKVELPKRETDFDNEENQEAIVEQNLMNNPNFNKKNTMSLSKDATDFKQRAVSQGFKNNNTSRYRNIPSENLKFQQFIDLIFDSRMNKDDVKFEIISYVQAVETNYNNTIQELKVRNDRIKNQLRKEKAKQVNDVIERGDLENLFVDCVEDVRRNVIKRRLKAEIIGKKKIGKFDETSVEARDFEDSLLKLANLAKDRVKFTEFTSQDRNNLLDLFVNNEKTLLKMYEILFPRKTNSTAFKVNSLKQISVMKNSSDTIRIAGNLAQKSDLLKGDSILQRSIDDTQAGTDNLNQSTILPSIMPAMNSIQSNDMGTNSLLQKSTNTKFNHQNSPDQLTSGGRDDHLTQGSNFKINQNTHNKGLSMGAPINLKSMNVAQGKKSSFNL